MTVLTDQRLAPVDPRDPIARLEGLLDPGSLRPFRAADDSGVRTVRGRIDGQAIIAYCTDATRAGGSIGGEASRHIVDAIDAAVRERCPVVGLWHSGGAKLA
jgi:acetyl-CoA/propionyl-CoA carboxylase carboxyl transferase subunit